MPYINGNKTLAAVRTKYLNVDDVYPVGAVYVSVNSTSPASLFGGTWERINSKFLYGTNDDANIGATGGNDTHNHTLGNGHAKITVRGTSGWSYATPKNVDSWIPSKYSDADAVYQNFDGSFTIDQATALGGTTDNANNLPPYLKVAIWKRTA